MSSTRRSSRLQVRPVVNLAEEPASDPDGDNYHPSEEDEERRPKRPKRQVKPKSSQKNIKGRRGKLAKLPQMPLDILFEIFGHLAPLDLLHLARTTKPLRDVLMSRHSVTIWRQALGTFEGLPPCPPELNEPQYTRLAFDHHCYFCQAPSVFTVLWAVRVRACKNCVNEKFMFTFDTEGIMPTAVRQALRSFGCWYIGHGINEVRIRGARRHEHYSPRFLTTDVEQLFAQALEIINTDGDRTKFSGFLEERKKMVASVSQHATECERWYDSKRSGRREELQDVRSLRREAILERLTKKGWDSELQQLQKTEPYAFQHHPLVKQPKELTDRIWANIEKPLLAWLQVKKEERLAEEHLQRISARAKILKELYHRYNMQHVGEISPNVADIFDLPDFQKVIGLGVDVTVTEDMFAPAIATLPGIVEHWRTENLDKLAQLIPSSAEVASTPNLNKRKQLDADSSLSVLNLATSVFKCGHCFEAFHYKRLFHHRCLTSPYQQIGYDKKGPENNAYFALGSVPHHHARVFGGSTYAPEFSEIAETLVKMNQLDPKHATLKDMDAVDARFACQACGKNPLAGQKVMTWQATFNHRIHHNHQEEQVEWLRLSPDEEKRAKDREEELMVTMERVAIWKCNKCFSPSGYLLGQSRAHTKSELIQHLSTAHGILDAREGEHYHKDLDRIESYGGIVITLKPAMA